MSNRDSNTSSLTERYRPQNLRELRGQPAVVRSLRSFLCSPFSQSFVFSGPTGVGKTAAAWALSRELGLAVEWEELGGLYQIPSGLQDGRAVQELAGSCRLRPMYGSGWKVAIINEADRMTSQAEMIWLDVLEALPPRTVVIFTTNDLYQLTDRLIGRCESLEFSGTSPAFRRSMLRLVRSVWESETGRPAGRLPRDLGLYQQLGGEYSIRLALQQIAPYVRSGDDLPEAFGVPLLRETVGGVSVSGSASAKKAWATRRRREAVR